MSLSGPYCFLRFWCSDRATLEVERWLIGRRLTQFDWCASGVEKFRCGHHQPDLHRYGWYRVRPHALSLACVALSAFPDPDRYCNRRDRKDTLLSSCLSHKNFGYGRSRLSAKWAIATTTPATRTGYVVDCASPSTWFTGLGTYCLPSYRLILSLIDSYRVIVIQVAMLFAGGLQAYWSPGYSGNISKQASCAGHLLH